ncbi:replication protein C, IncQ-type [Candidatus Igneacidithiobacillus taiwanensis]|uniref:replication protein C, IncQ-type n=1 Tax=Candidatus Igneacidithiobacillus taiwanensis TaxID=1945924 RepID=UPI00289E9FF6|nr:replication protein C, IncQ-type [Candidatus Igneacidithiobacillus taiwanensis]
MTQRHIKPAYAKIDAAHVLDGLFVPTSGKKREKLFVPLRKFGNCKIGFQGFDQLGAFDQSILLAVSAQLGIDGLRIEAKPKGPISQQLRKDIYKPNKAEDDGSDLRTKKTSLRSLLLDAGSKDIEGGHALQLVKDSLNRLSNAQIREIGSDGWDRRCNLLSVSFNEKTGEVFVAANPRLSQAVFRGQHVKVSLFERNLLNSQAAKILHCWLSSNIRLGKTLGNGNGAQLDTLLPHVWGIESMEKASAKVKSTRRSQLRDALNEIESATKRLGIPWVVDQTSNGLVSVSRPKELCIEDRNFDTPHELEELYEEMRELEAEADDQPDDWVSPPIEDWYSGRL